MNNPPATDNLAPGTRVILLGSVFIVAACGLVYELVAGAVSSYLIGDAVTQFSLVIGVFGGCSSILMFAVSAFFNAIFAVFFYPFCAVVGILIGIEIPLLVRILKTEQTVSAVLSHVLALDYVGALVGSLLFPLVILPYLGLSRASVVFGLLNLAVAALGLKFLREPGRTLMIVRLVCAFVLLCAALVFSNRLVGFLEDLLYQDDIVYAQSTPYQRIVLTRWNTDLRLYLNGSLQFSSVDEARYHEALVIPAMAAVPQAQAVLILGGGDGLAAREVLKYSSVQQITLVDIDPAMTNLGRQRPELVALNQGALQSPKVTIINTDALRFVQDSPAFFDVILIDLPDPNTETLSKLYSTSFYALCARRLRPTGVLVTQATSPFYAPEAFWCIERTLTAAITSPEIPGLTTAPYHVNVPSFGEWGFVLAGKRTITPAALTITVPTRFLNDATLRAMFTFSEDLRAPTVLNVNRLEQPVLYTYYEQGWDRYH